MKMGNSFAEHMKQFMYDRMDEADKKARQTKDYLRLSSKRDDLHKKIKRGLPQELHVDLITLEELHSERGCIECEFHYRQGFSDAVKLIVQTLSL